MDEVESRFTHLLQPIRDLTKNWEVDVAAQLGEYLEELDQICISFDGGKTTMNFAEAALLIQGSACIYSKKVEYLYSLVYQALDFISNKKRDKQPASIGVDGVDQDATFANRQEQEEFLSLDDIQDPSKTNVDLKKDCTPNIVNVVPLTPMTLVPPEEGEKKNNPLYSRKGEVLASRKDFRMNSCTPHGCGAFMLVLAEISPTHFHYQMEQMETNRNTAEAQNGTIQEMTAVHPLERTPFAEPVQALNFSEEADPRWKDNEGGAEGVDFMPLDEHHEVDMEMDPVCEEFIERQKALQEDKAYTLRDRVPLPERSLIVKENVDPWRSLDPFSTTEEKPFRKGKHFVLPRSVGDTPGNKRKRRGPSKVQDFMTWFLSTDHDTSEKLKLRRKGPTFADMEVLYWKHLKERIAAQKQLQRRMGAHFAKEVEDFQRQQKENVEELNPIEEDRAGDYLDHDDMADGFSDHEDLPPSLPSQRMSDAGLGVMGANEIPLSYEELVRRNVELFIANSQKYAQETVLSLRVRDWEDKMFPQLQEQEDRGTFDIHDYGNRLVAGYSQVGEWRTFASLMAGKEPFEVCRFMLASLQLANDYTVEIAQKPGLYEAVDTISLRLLSQQRAHERFKTYTAPSISDQ
ncbi:condensin-2 complex subunit H2 isoform X2 [Ambystoma mexicanum]|uniref:condensin-2 complex subunit H2 isoform X2 n=1 Tax=Ambystoma mexicanum TaxID=8296 RepID=UPI0037E772C7